MLSGHGRRARSILARGLKARAVQMYKRIVPTLIACAVFASMSSAAHGQLDGVYEFDAGGDGSSWNDPANWEQVTDPNGNPISGNPAAPPDAVTSAELPMLGVVIDAGMPGQTALDVLIGTLGGAGSLNMSGGDLTLRDLLIGNGSAGSYFQTGGALIAGDDIVIGSSSAGMMTITGDAMASTFDDIVINANSALVVTGGILNVGDRLITNDNATIMVDGGTIISSDDFQFRGDSQVTVTSGLMQVRDKLQFDDASLMSMGKLTINGGVVRSEEYGLDGDARGLIEINGDGVYEVAQSQLSLAEAQMLIADGTHLTTSEFGLAARSVVVPDFFGETDLTFTQIYAIPAPGTGLLLSLGVLAAGRRRRSVNP